MYSSNILSTLSRLRKEFGQEIFSIAYHTISVPVKENYTQKS